MDVKRLPQWDAASPAGSYNSILRYKQFLSDGILSHIKNDVDFP
jgi:hypothetical protein